MIRKTDPQAIAPYLKDASNFTGGHADEVLIPETSGELAEFLKSNDRPVTVSGAGTGVTASRIPFGGIIVSLERLNAIGEIENGTLDVGPAVSLKDLQEKLESTSYFYPPNPTETLASLGGTLATNASGSRSYKFGVTRDYVVQADIVLADGGTVTLSRGTLISEPLLLDDGREISFPEIEYVSPACKNAAGYYVRPGMDWLDLFIGSDGTLCIFTRIRLRLLPRPADFISGILFFNEEETCWKLVDSIRSVSPGKISPCSLEYFDQFSLIRLRKKFGTVPDRAQAALFFEQDVGREEDYDPLLQTWFEFLEGQEVMLDDSWFSRDYRDLKKCHEFRHAIPIMLNEENSRRGRTKIGTDMAVPDKYYMGMMRFYKQELSESGLDYVVFGHLGDNHLHINFLPGEGESEKALKTYQTLADQILKWEGTVSAEHGIGKLKKEFFARMAGPRALEDFRQIKKTLDPGGLLGLGNII